MTIWSSFFSMSMFCRNILVPFIPTDGAPAATAARAYSIWTSFPEGLQNKQNNTIVIVSLQQQECISVGCVPSTAVAVRGEGAGGVPGGLSRGGGGGVCLGGGVSQHALVRGASAPVHAGIHAPPTHTRLWNITFPQLRLRTVTSDIIINHIPNWLLHELDEIRSIKFVNSNKVLTMWILHHSQAFYLYRLPAKLIPSRGRKVATRNDV